MTKIFGTDGIRCLVNQEPLTAETCLKISKTVAYLLTLNKRTSGRVIVCKDTRLSGYLYEPLVTAGFVSMGVEVILVGPLPTPSVPLLIKTLRADIGVMITASHNPYQDNGIKVFDENGLKITEQQESEIENAFNHPDGESKNDIGHKEIEFDYAPDQYVGAVRNYLKNKIKNENNIKSDHR